MNLKNENVDSGRRRFLAVTSTAGLVAIGGCLGNTSSATPDDGSPGTSESDATTPTEKTVQSDDSENKDNKLTFGNFYTTSLGVRATVHKVWFQESYEYDDAGWERVMEPDDGYKWLFAEFTAINDGDEWADLPGHYHITAIYEDRKYDAKNPRSVENSNYEGYESDEVGSGVEESGVLLFEVPDSMSENDVIIDWELALSEGGGSVQWSN